MEPLPITILQITYESLDLAIELMTKKINEAYLNYKNHF